MEQITDIEEQIKLKQLSLIKTKMKTSLVDSKKALQELLLQTQQKQTSPVVLIGAIIMAENMTISKPQKEDQEKPVTENLQTQVPENTPEEGKNTILVTDPELLPETARVITSAINNPNSNLMVINVAESAVENLSQNAQKGFKERISDGLQSLRQTIRDFQQRQTAHFEVNRTNTPYVPATQNSAVENQSKYGVINCSGMIRDNGYSAVENQSKYGVVNCSGMIRDNGYSVVENQSKYGVVNSFGIIRDSEGKHHALSGKKDKDGKWKPELNIQKDNSLSKNLMNNVSKSRE